MTDAADLTDIDDLEVADDEDGPSEYTSETVAVAAVRREVVTRPANATGRRKEAVARVRLVPGTGQWTINGRALDVYFPNKVHQQLVNDPFKILDLEGRYDVIARLHGGGTSGQAGALRLGVARALNEIDTEENRPAWICVTRVMPASGCSGWTVRGTTDEVG